MNKIPYINNNYFIDPIALPKYEGVWSRCNLMEYFLQQCSDGVSHTNSVLEKLGIVLIKIPKTGTQAFERKCIQSFFNNKK